jgi:dihydrolipoamide dehydrogenase
MSDYDLVVIGGGPGGYVAAIRAAQLGLRTALVEQDGLGGTCLQRGCIPTKTMTRAARLLYAVKKAKTAGVTCEGVAFDYAAHCKGRAGVVNRLAGGVAQLLGKNKVERKEGRAAFADPHTIAVEGKDACTLHAAKVIVATGSRPWAPPPFAIDGRAVCTSDEALAWTALPQSVVIAGGGYIGCEFASALAAFGCEVTVVEMTPQLLPGGDADISRELLGQFKKRKIKVRLSSPVARAAAEGGRGRVTLEGGETLDADRVLVTLGRRPYTEGLNLPAAGLAAGEKGEIPVDADGLTAVRHVYAVGDVTGEILLAHYASARGLAAAAHAAGHRVPHRRAVVPAAIFTLPEIATVGLTEAQAAETGRAVRAVKFPFMALGRAQAMDEAEGFVKIVADEETQEILGVAMIGPEVTELIAEAALAMQLEATVEELAETIHAHPTYPEALMEAAELWGGRAIHV